jgi:hypothetical protein
MGGCMKALAKRAIMAATTIAPAMQGCRRSAFFHTAF